MISDPIKTPKIKGVVSSESHLGSHEVTTEEVEKNRWDENHTVGPSGERVSPEVQK